MTETFNTRYVNYCRAHGRTMEEQRAADAVAWPGGINCGFILWHRLRLAEGRQALPAAFLCGNIVDHPAYDAWLSARVDELIAEAAKPKPSLARRIVGAITRRAA